MAVHRLVVCHGSVRRQLLGALVLTVHLINWPAQIHCPVTLISYLSNYNTCLLEGQPECLAGGIMFTWFH